MSRGAQTWLVIFAVAMVVFATWPGLDIAVADLFHRTPGGWVGDHPALEAVRNGVWLAVEGGFLLFLGLTLAAWAAGSSRRIPVRVWGFAALAMALGPGILVNVILKAHWGRVRPKSIAEFGGDGLFTPPFEMAGECTRNCSFVSGEAAAAVTLSLILWLLFGRRVAGPARRWIGAGLVLLAVGVAMIRVAGGGHFLSDVVFSALFSVAVTLLLWRWMKVEPASWKLTSQAFVADMAATVDRVRGWGLRLAARLRAK